MHLVKGGHFPPPRGMVNGCSRFLGRNRRRMIIQVFPKNFLSAGDSEGSTC